MRYEYVTDEILYINSRLWGAIDLLQLYQIIHPEMTLDLTNEEEKSEKELVQTLMVCFSVGFVSLINLT